MSVIRVDHHQLAAIATQVNSGASSIESTLQQLASFVGPLEAEWEGTGQAKFEGHWQEWQRSAASLQHALHAISTMLNEASTQYVDGDQSVASLFS